MDKQINPLGDALTYTKDILGKGIVIPTPTDTNAAANMATLAPGGGKGAKKQKEEKEQKMEETKESFNFDEIFDGEDLSEEFKEKIKVVFEAAVNSRVSEISEQLTKEANTILEQEIQNVSNQLTEKLDDYLNYVIEEWMDENKLSLEEGIKVDIAESFLTGLKELFETHYIEMPEEKSDIFDKLQERTEELETELNGSITENLDLKKQLLEYQSALAFLESTDGLTDTQIEKLASLAEGLEYETVDQYVDKLNILKESYVKQVTSPKVRELVESFEETTDKTIVAPSSDPMSVYISTIQRQSKKV